MTLNKLVYDVKELLGMYSNDAEIDDRYIEYLYGIKRAKYLRQELNNLQRTIDQSLIQTVCLELEEVPINQCNIGLDCTTILRTKKPIPKPLELHVKTAINSVRPVNRISIPFNFINKERAIYALQSNFANGIYAFLDADMHIYLISHLDTIKLIKCITVTAVFEDPLDLILYPACCGCTAETNPCMNKDTMDYPIQPHYIDLIRGEIVNELINKFKLPEDKLNNSEDDNK